ncbi:hypothetical protein F5Y09DRAFT_289774 [Xylaria sp. FL1042]|nr:hypothetical protein F5Y09DRAFT_289774 [Xylaria sp. FL1042]
MDGSYIPPFRRGATGDTEAPPAEQAPGQSHQNNRYNNRGAYGGQGNRGYSRGGRGGYKKNFINKPKLQPDQSDLYLESDIDNYFWGSEKNDAKGSHSTTFRDSKDHLGELSHMLLFFGANPRWPNDRIVFAKSNLTLLPEYAAKKAENGEWETENKIRKVAGEDVKFVEDEALENKDAIAIAVSDNHGTEAVSQAGETTLVEAQTLSHPSTQKQSLKFNKSSTEEETTVSTSPPNLDKDNKCQIKQEHTQESDSTPNQDSTEGIQDLSSSNQPGSDGVDYSISKEPTDNEKRDQYTGVEVEGSVDTEVQATPISTPPSTKTIGHHKYMDIRKEEVQLTPAPNQPTTARNRMKYTDIRLIPSNELYDEPLPSEPLPTYPAITPIDYVPANPLPIAVFEERRVPWARPGGSQARFAFKGWFKVSRVNILAPHSAELVRMLQQKWERKDRFGNIIGSKPRDASAWNASLAQEWAVVRFELLEGENTPPPPQIEKLPEPERPVGMENKETKSVNEMLSDMRLNDGNKDGRENETHEGGVITEPKGDQAKIPLPDLE